MKRFISACLGFASIAVMTIATAPPAVAATGCANTSTGNTALTDLATGTYQGEQGGLYPGGSNQPPAAYRSAGIEAARSVVPRNESGAPASNGRIVFISIGMSNAQQEFEYFQTSEASDSQLSPAVALVNGAQSGQDASAWTSPSAPTWDGVDQNLTSAGFTPQQVQVVWLKHADVVTDPNLGFNTYAHTLEQQLTSISSIAAQRYPNLRQVFVSARTYGGYAVGGPNPEPYAYQTGFADKWLVAKSVANPGQRPWLGWGPYFWTDGTRKRADGLQWACSDTADGTHPSPSGLAKINTALHSLFVSSVFTPWFTGSAPAANPTPSPQPGTDPVKSPVAAPSPAPGATTPASPVAPPPAAEQPTASPGAIEGSTPLPSTSQKPPPGVLGTIAEANSRLSSMPTTQRQLLLLALAVLVVLNGLAAIGLLMQRVRRPVPISGSGGNTTNGRGPTPSELPVSVGSATSAQGSEEDGPPPAR